MIKCEKTNPYFISYSNIFSRYIFCFNLQLIKILNIVIKFTLWYYFNEAVINIKGFLKFLFFVFLFVLIGGAIAFSGFIGVSVFDGFTNAYPREDTKANIKEFEMELNIAKNYFDLEEISISSTKEGHVIPAIYIKDEGNKNIAVLVHGMGGTKETVLSPASIFLELGYDVISIDQRNSGDNMADYNTFGVLESYDILDAINYARSIVGENGKVILWGESYGGASSAIALGRDESNVDYMILDCPVSNGKEFLEEILQDVEDEQGIPVSYMMFTGNIVTRFRLKFSFDDFVVTKWLEKTNTPTLIFNSKVDTVTPERMGIELYNAIPHDKKMLVTSETSPHVEIHYLERDLYKDAIAEFLEKY